MPTNGFLADVSLVENLKTLSRRVENLIDTIEQQHNPHEASWLLSVVDSLIKLRELQASSTEASGFGMDPVKVLAQFNALPDGPWKSHLFTQNKAFIEVALREQQWRETKSRSQTENSRVGIRTPRVGVDLFSIEYEELSAKDPAAAQAFFRAHQNEIRTEFHRASIGDDRPVTEGELVGTRP